MRPSTDREPVTVASGGRGRWARNDTQERLLAANDELARPVERLAPVLPGMARDLAQARRENVAQKRQLEELPARLTLPDRSSDASRARPRKAAQIVNDRTALAVARVARDTAEYHVGREVLV
jgi:hypothetical protein